MAEYSVTRRVNYCNFTESYQFFSHVKSFVSRSVYALDQMFNSCIHYKLSRKKANKKKLKLVRKKNEPPSKFLVKYPSIHSSSFHLYFFYYF